MLNKHHQRSNDLPEPGADAIAHSQRLTKLIQTEIAIQGALSFARFMELALYAPGLGYYSAGTHKFGIGGDFITAPDLSPLFAQCVARQCAQVLTFLKGGDILEFGAGSGNLAADILLSLAEQKILPEHYFILEISADLRQRQQACLAHRAPQWLDRVVWLETLPTTFRGVVLANEVLDAMPVHRFKIHQEEIQEYFIAFTNDAFAWRLQKTTNPRLLQHIQALEVALAEGYESEINLTMAPWLASINAFLQQGLILLIDYGFPRHEYYHPQRDSGTLMCHYQHRAHSNPLILLGLQDITAHIDFTQVAETADELGLEVAGFTNHASFLLSCGLLELSALTSNDPATQWTTSQQIKMLTLPSEMGELFKVMALTRDLPTPLLGFTLLDLCSRL
ncbi:MAG: SAM-dependent methyltransferase [Gammaproteobacteria bacterium]